MAKQEGAKESDKLIGKLADAGEGAISRLAQAPGAARFVEGVNSLKARVDDLTKRVSGIEALERRVARLEEQVGQRPASPAPLEQPPSAEKATGPGESKGTSPN
jgi:hypothetical protein